MTFAEPLPKKPKYNVEKLQAALEANRPPLDLPPTMLKIDEIDVSGWDDFATVGGGTFFDKPIIRSTIYQSGYPRDMVLPCSFFSVISTDKQVAINTLRRDLLFIKNMWPKIKVVGFLAKPSIIEVTGEVKPDEDADTVVTVDLRGPVPGKRKWAAFCFLFAYEESFWDYSGREGYKSIAVEDWVKMGLPSAVREGEVGLEIKAPVELLNPIKVEGEPLVLSEPHFDPMEVEYIEPHLQDQKLTTIQARGETNVAKTVAALHPEIQAAADKHGIDLGAKPGRELEEMRKYFGVGSGLYIATVDFQNATVRSTLLTEEAQKRIFNALKDNAKPKRKRKSAKKPAKKVKAKRLTRRRSRR